MTFSRNVTLSLSRTCVSHCKYCAFQTHQPHLHLPDEVEALLDRAAKRSVKELLILTGDDPGHHPGVRARLAELGFDGLRRLRGVVLRARAGARAAAAHQPRRALARGAGPAARGHRLAGVDGGVGPRRPRRPPGLADQGPAAAAADDPLGGRAEDPVHARDPRRHRRDRGRTASPRCEALAEVHAEHGHLQEVILQNFVPHRRYYGEEPADIATEAAERFWRTGLRDVPIAGVPDWAQARGSVSLDDLVELIGVARELLPGVGIQVPPNLASTGPSWSPRARPTSAG